ncbi:MAG: hypothetical protein R3C03_12745 [Pirellulaceae bacterium]
MRAKIMNLDEMKVIWDQQKNEPLFAINRDELHATVSRKASCIDRVVSIFEWAMIAALLMVAVSAVSKRIWNTESLEFMDWIVIFATLAVAVVPISALLLSRYSRRRRESAFQSNIIGNIDKSISQLRYQLNKFKSFHWWFALPMAIILLLNLWKPDVAWSDIYGQRGLVSLGSFLLSMVVCYGSIWLESKRFQKPSLDRLLKLREKLENENIE